MLALLLVCGVEEEELKDKRVVVVQGPEKGQRVEVSGGIRSVAGYRGGWVDFWDFVLFFSIGESN